MRFRAKETRNCRFRDRTLGERYIERWRERNSKGKSSSAACNFFPRFILVAISHCSNPPSEPRSYTHKQRGTFREIQISGVAVIKRNPRYECTGRPCSFRRWCIISLPFVEPAIDLSSIPSFLPFVPYTLSVPPTFFPFFFFFNDWGRKNPSVVRDVREDKGKK